MNVGLTVGMRAGMRAMAALNLGRAEAVRLEVVGGHFFAQGVEGVTGCSPIRDTLVFTQNTACTADWSVTLHAEETSVRVALREATYTGADEVLGLPDDVLFTADSLTMEGVGA